MFQHLAPWNIVPEREVHVRDTEYEEELEARVAQQNQHIANLQNINQDATEQYQRLMNWTRELEVSNKAILDGLRDYMTEKDLYVDEERDRLTDLILKNKEAQYQKKESEHGVVLERSSLF